MTIITAIHNPDTNITWLGSNSRATIGSFVAPSDDHKWYVIDGWVIGITGSGPKIEALEAARNDFPGDDAMPHQILKFMKTAYEGFDIGETDEGLKRYCGSGLLVHRSGRIWDFDNSLCLTGLPPGKFWARGSGMDLAIGAALALREYDLGHAELTRRVLDIAIETDVDCPGAPMIQTFDADGNLSEPKKL